MQQGRGIDQYVFIYKLSNKVTRILKIVHFNSSRGNANSLLTQCCCWLSARYMAPLLSTTRTPCGATEVADAVWRHFCG